MARYNIPAVLLFILAAGAVLALSPRVTQRVQSSVLGIVSPFLKTGSTLQRQFAGFREGLKTLEQLEQDNRQLLVQNKELRAVNQMLRDLEQENNNLRRALEYRERSVFQLVPARIIARDGSTWWNTVKINRGFEDGIEADMPVLTEDGLVGKTTTVAARAATVLLISDENCRVAATVEGTQEQGIVRGSRTSTHAQPEITLTFLSKEANLQPGQRVYSSGLGGVFPSGVLLGAIKEFRVRELDGYATVVPAVDLAQIEDVFVVVGQK